jgi:hypothetical protein
MQPIKFKYHHKHIVFFIKWRGTEVEIMRSGLVDNVQDLIRLRKIAQAKANDMLGVLRLAA